MRLTHATPASWLLALTHISSPLPFHAGRWFLLWAVLSGALCLAHARSCGAITVGVARPRMGYTLNYRQCQQLVVAIGVKRRGEKDSCRLQVCSKRPPRLR